MDRGSLGQLGVTELGNTLMNQESVNGEYKVRNTPVSVLVLVLLFHVNLMKLIRVVMILVIVKKYFVY